MQSRPWATIVGWCIALGVPMTPLSGTWIGYTLISIGVVIAIWRGWVWAEKQNWQQGATRFILIVPSILLALLAGICSYLGGLPVHPITATEQASRENGKQEKVPFHAPRETVSSKVFRNETIVIDGKSFVDCEFINVTMVYKGNQTFDMIHNTFRNTLRVKITYPVGTFGKLLHNLGFLTVKLADGSALYVEAITDEEMAKY